MCVHVCVCGWIDSRRMLVGRFLRRNQGGKLLQQTCRRLQSTLPEEVQQARDKYEPVYHNLSTKAVQSGESGGRVSMQDCLTTPIAQTSAYTFKDTQQLIA